MLTRQALPDNEKAELEHYMKSMRFRLFTDPGVEMALPSSLDELEALEDIVDNALKKSNGGLGVPVSYRLASIASVLPQWRRTPSLPVDGSDQQRLTEILCSVLSVQAEAERCYRQISEYAYCIPADEWRKFESDCRQYRETGPQLRTVSTQQH